MSDKSEGVGARACWFVGASFGGTNDQTEKFIKNGIWEVNKPSDKESALVKSMQQGDRIAIKATYVRKNNLPFDNKGNTVSVMSIKAVGTIKEKSTDGQQIKVDWIKNDPPREWYFYTYRGTIWRVIPGEWETDGLIKFAFDNADQEIDRFRNAPYWKERFGDSILQKSKFEWTRFYEDFADKLLMYKNNRQELVNAIHEIASRIGIVTNLQDKLKDGTSVPLQDICPFTVFGIFNRGISHSNRMIVAEELAKFLGVEHKVPESYDGIPVLNNNNSWFFGYEEKRLSDDIDILWNVYEYAIKYSYSEEQEIKHKFIEAYNTATSRYGVGWNLSIGLYWIRPWTYMTLDGQSQIYITKKLGIPIKKNGPKNRCNANDYLELIDTLEIRFLEDKYPVHSFPELSYSAWLFKDSKQVDNIDDDLKTSGIGPDEDLEEIDSDLKSTFPRFDDMMIPYLNVIADGEEYLAKDICQQLKKETGFDGYDHIRLESSGQPLFDNRVGWAKSYLKKAGMVEFPKRGYVRITGKGMGMISLPSIELEKYRNFTDFFSLPANAISESKPITPYSIDNIIDEGCFISREKLKTILDRLNHKKNVIIQGPPGTGKTWLAKKLAYALMGQIDDGTKCRVVQFHPNLSYEDFIRGWRPTGDGILNLVDGPFLETVKSASANPKSKFVIVIEEINRGNPAQIFGEMLTLLEADKRNPDEAIELTYRKEEGERLSIPTNVFIIGTMNIADRSLALVDLAFRRRFAFIDLEPKFGEVWRKWVSENFNIDINFLSKIENRISELNNIIENDQELGAQYKIGHSYFTPSKSISINDVNMWYRDIIETEIGPLLYEYWYDSHEKADKAKKQLIEGL
jgi:5-methylcytosine-specific restriction protein B